jgi:hypothetical protein
MPGSMKGIGQHRPLNDDASFSYFQTPKITPPAFNGRKSRQNSFIFVRSAQPCQLNNLNVDASWRNPPLHSFCLISVGYHFEIRIAKNIYLQVSFFNPNIIITLNMIFSITYYLEVRNAIIFSLYISF